MVLSLAAKHRQQLSVPGIDRTSFQVIGDIVEIPCHSAKPFPQLRLVKHRRQPSCPLCLFPAVFWRMHNGLNARETRLIRLEINVVEYGKREPQVLLRDM